MNHVRLAFSVIIGCFFLFHSGEGRILQDEKPSAASPAQNTEPAGTDERMLQVGEELEYSVHYSFFNIGTIHFKVTDKEERNGRTMYRAFAFMDSNPSLSWLVDLHIRFYTVMDQDAFTYDWLSEDSTSKMVTYRKMLFDYDSHKMHFEWGRKLKSNEYKKDGERIITISNNCQDGLSLFYYARQHAREKRTSKIPTFIDTNEVTTNVNFGIEHDEEEIDAVNYPIDVMKLDGRADFVGVFGLTGGFEGVFSNDAAGIPITARMKVILGSVKVELKNWKRNHWTPPKAAEAK
ncbi:MAG: DUF3108 domain-containing protein [Ignavibacteriae bacterium]|nr:MAG: DUF3108 domain-containing protein [Ignavibacteriota bacterium]